MKLCIKKKVAQWLIVVFLSLILLSNQLEIHYDLHDVYPRRGKKVREDTSTWRNSLPPRIHNVNIGHCNERILENALMYP